MVGILCATFQYRKRYGPVATASLESRSRTGLKWQIGKPPRFFPLLPAVSVNTSSFFTTFIRFYTSIYADFRIHKQSGKPHFRLFFIIAGFNTNCQTAFWFSKTLDFPNSRLWIFHMLHPERTGYFWHNYTPFWRHSAYIIELFDTISWCMNSIILSHTSLRTSSSFAEPNRSAEHNPLISDTQLSCDAHTPKTHVNR